MGVVLVWYPDEPDLDPGLILAHLYDAAVACPSLPVENGYEFIRELALRGGHNHRRLVETIKLTGLSIDEIAKLSLQAFPDHCLSITHTLDFCVEYPYSDDPNDESDFEQIYVSHASVENQGGLPERAIQVMMNAHIDNFSTAGWIDADEFLRLPAKIERNINDEQLAKLFSETMAICIERELKRKNHYYSDQQCFLLGSIEFDFNKWG